MNKPRISQFINPEASIKKPGFGIFGLISLIIAFTLQIVLTGTTVVAQSPAAIQVDENTLTNNFPEGLNFHILAHSEQVWQKIYLHYGSEGRTCQSSGARQELDFDPSRDIDLAWELDFTRSGTFAPGTQMWWQWEIIDTQGNSIFTEKQTASVQDQRYNWRQIHRDGLIVQWYEGSQSYGSQIHQIARKSLDRLESEVGISSSSDIWITIYPTFEKLRYTQKNSTEWVGGLAFVEHNAILLAVPEDGMKWAQESIPHELAHLLTAARVYNCSGATLPVWLSEGLAEYVSVTDPEPGLKLITEADLKGDLPPLRSLDSGFSAYSDEATLSYAQSASVVAFLEDTYGPEGMVSLLDAIKEGNRIDDALQMTHGFDTDGLDRRWRESLGLTPLSNQSEKSTPTATSTKFPTLALWTSAVRLEASSTLTPQITASQTSRPSATQVIVPTRTPYPILTSTPTVSPGSATSSWSFRSAGWYGGGAVLLLAGVGVFIIIYRNRREKE